MNLSNFAINKYSNMPCSICRTSGHTKNNCPHERTRGLYIYQVICKLFNETRNPPSNPTETRNYCRILKEMSAESFKELLHVIKTRFPQHYNIASQIMHRSDLLYPSVPNYERRYNEEILVIMASYFSNHSTPSLVFMGLSNVEINNMLNDTSFQNNHYLKRRIWRSTRCWYNQSVTHMEFGTISKLKIVSDITFIFPKCDSTCPICLEEFTIENISQLACGHYICIACINICHEKLLPGKQDTCCLCRNPFSSISIPLLTKTK